MKLVVTKEWCLAAARHEGDVEVGAGAIAFDPEPSKVIEARDREPALDALHIAFGRMVNLLRRQRRLSVEKLAETARIDLVELVAIENDPHHQPEPRAVSQLAHQFRIDPKSFQQLAGNAVVRDAHMKEEAVRFAARSGSIEKLSKEEALALEHFIAVLGAATDKSSNTRK
jgi:hypothetical protein